MIARLPVSRVLTLSTGHLMADDRASLDLWSLSEHGPACMVGPHGWCLDVPDPADDPPGLSPGLTRLLAIARAAACGVIVFAREAELLAQLPHDPAF